MSRELFDQEVRERIRTSLDETLIVEAAAGTGKTTALVERIVEVVRRGRGELAGMVAVTFTEKAAGELKLRLRTELEKARKEAAGQPEVLTRLERGRAQLEEARIGTIHGFCADLLKERPLQAGVDPLFEVATEEEAHRLYRQAFERWFQEKLKDPPPGIRRLLRQPAEPEGGPVDRLAKAGWELIERRDFPAPWEIRRFDREAEIDSLAARLLSLAERSALCSNEKDNLYRDLGGLRSFASELNRQEKSSGSRDYDHLEHRMPWLRLGYRKGRGAYGPGVSRQEILDERKSLMDRLRGFRERAGADLAAHLQHELQELAEPYRKLKTASGRLDFLDLLLGARNLLREQPASARKELQDRFTHIFIDEFQDTDPLQAEILLLLASDNPEVEDWRQVTPVAGKLFIVADPKQSIYRFRRADVGLYEQTKRRLLEKGASLVHLSVSFRAVPDLQELVNASLSQVMTGSDLAQQASYVPLDRYREAVSGQPPVVALPIPRPYGSYGRVTREAVQDSEPEALAEWVRWLIEESGWRVTSRDWPEPHPIQPSDICLLFRRFVSRDQDITRPYLDALQARDIPHVLVGGRGFHQREEIETIRTALTAIERPDDELSVFATLRGPLFSLPDDDLFLFRSRHGSLHPFRKLSAELERSETEVADSLRILAQLHRGRNRRPIPLTMRSLLDETRAQAGFALRQAGEQVLANVLRVMQLARNFEAGGGLSFRGFVEQLEELARSGETTEQPLIEEGLPGVRLMTVHRAKGLEFPVVVLCDITCPPGTTPSRHIDPDRRLFAIRLAGLASWELLDHAEVETKRESAESERLLYVAATRARDLLVLPAVADEPEFPSWAGSLSPALYPHGRTYRLPIVAPGCPRFGEEAVAYRPSSAPIPPGEGIKPGQHKPRAGGHRVVWWDPNLLALSPGVRPGLRRHWILEGNGGTADSEASRQHGEWLARRAALVERGSRPLLRVLSATEKSVPAPPGPLEIAVEEIPRVPHRPSGPGFGALVHAMLETAELDADAGNLNSLARSLGRVLGNSEKEMAAAAEAVARALAHPLLRRAAAASRAGLCHREAPVLYRHPDGSLIEGVLDLAFREGPEADWTVVDFKTDARRDPVQQDYRRQLGLYMEGLRQASGIRARGVLLYV